MSSLNYLSIFITAVVVMAIGALWYGPLFGAYWMKLAGITPETMKRANLTARQAMIFGCVSTLVSTTALAYFIQSAVLVINVADALCVALVIWAGFTATTSLGNVLWENRPWKLWLFNITHQLVMLMVAATILFVLA